MVIANSYSFFYNKYTFMTKGKKLSVQGTEINLFTKKSGEFISLTDMLKAKDGDFLSQIG